MEDKIGRTVFLINTCLEKNNMKTNRKSAPMAKAGTASKRSSRGTVTKRKKVSANGARHAHGTVRSTTKDAPLSRDELNKLNAYWRAANYLSVGQIYLYDNPLLKKPLSKEHIKPRLLGHWGTTPGLNFIYAHLNRLIKQHDLDMLYITGPGHGGPGLVANAYLE